MGKKKKGEGVNRRKKRNLEGWEGEDEVKNKKWRKNKDLEGRRKRKQRRKEGCKGEEKWMLKNKNMETSFGKESYWFLYRLRTCNVRDGCGSERIFFYFHNIVWNFSVLSRVVRTILEREWRKLWRHYAVRDSVFVSRILRHSLYRFQIKLIKKNWRLRNDCPLNDTFVELT